MKAKICLSITEAQEFLKDDKISVIDIVEAFLVNTNTIIIFYEILVTMGFSANAAAVTEPMNFNTSTQP